MASLTEAIDIKRKMFFEFEGAPYHCLDVDISKPTARGGQTLVRIKMRNLLTRAVFDRTFKAGDKFAEPDLEKFAQMMAFPIIPCDLCGSQEGLERNAMKAMLNDIEKRMPGRKDIMIRALGNIRPSHMLDPKLFDFLSLERNSQ